MKIKIAGKTIIIDKEDLIKINKYTWCETDNGHGNIYFKSWDGKRFIFLHRLIMGFPIGKQVDHKKGNPYDFRKSQLRICSNAQNVRNQKRHTNNSSGFKGVSWYKPCKKWRAKITVNRNTIHLGYFKNPKEAHQAYIDAAKKYFEEYRRVA